jgi:glucose/arabinose dehydrogenase
MMKRIAVFTALAAAASLSARLDAAVTLQAQLIAGGFSSPTFVTTAPGDNTHLYILEKGSSGTAKIKVHNLSTHVTSDFLTISGVATSGEQGLLGLAFDPNYATNGNFYVNYNATTSIAGAASVTTVAVFHANSPTVANPVRLGNVYTLTQTDQTNHKGGWIGFSPRAGDANNLYIAIGDGGNFNDTGNGHVAGGNAQSLTNHFGKILRINVNSASPNTHTIPANNPFAGAADVNSRAIFAYGLRNPFRDSFDRATGDLYIGDVGQDAREEIDVQKASNASGGENYGWRVREGFIQTPTVGGALTAGMTQPILDYAQDTGITTLAGRTVIGGYVYRGSAIPELAGTYIFGDYLGPQNVANPKTEIFSLKYDGTTVTEITDLTAMINTGQINNITSFGEDNFGEIYIVDVGLNSAAGQGEIYKLVAVPEPASMAVLSGGILLLLRRRRR